MHGTYKVRPFLVLIAFSSLLWAGSNALAADPDSEIQEAASTDETPSTADSAPRGDVDEILVTARKREENILEIPESVSSFSKTQIERSNISGLSDIALLVPNLYMSRRTDGFPNVSIRGTGAFGNTQGVGFYMDDVQLHGDGSSRFSDIERIEVLKGPQGILYGGTNIGGAVKYVVARPSSDAVASRVKVRAGEDSFYDVEAMLNVPLSESWAVRGSYFGEHNDSFLNNPNTPRLSGGVGASDGDVGDVTRYGFRIGVAGNLTERLSVYAAARNNRLDGPNDVWSRELSNNLTHNRNIDVSQNPRHERETWGWNIELNYDFDNVTLTSITSKTDTDSERDTDLDLTPERILDLFRDHRIDVFSQELRLTSTGGGAFQWQLGGFFQDYDRDLNSNLIIPGGVVLNPDLTGDPPAIPTIAEESMILAVDPFERSKRERENIAGFANGSYRWNDLELAGGIRVDRWESKRRNGISGISGSQRDTENLFRGSASYFFDGDRSMLYALYSQGFEPGDFNLSSFAGVSNLFGYGREKATNYEIGYKGRLFDDRLVLTATVFRLHYKDRQIELQDTAPDGSVIEGIVNAGDSRQWGWEGDAQLLLAPGLTFSAGYGYLDADWKTEASSAINGASLSGLTPPNTADWGASYALDYDGDLGGDTRLFGRIQVRQKGDATTNSQFFDVPGDDFPAFENDGFTVTDFHVGLGFQNIEIGVSVENVFDEEYYVDVQEFPNFAGAFVTPAVPGGQIIIGTLEQTRRVVGWVEVEF